MLLKQKGNLPFKSPLRELGHAMRSSGPLAQVLRVWMLLEWKMSVMNSVRHGCDKPQGDTGRGMVGWGQGMKKSTREKPQPLWWVHG